MRGVLSLDKGDIWRANIGRVPSGSCEGDVVRPGHGPTRTFSQDVKAWLQQPLTVLKCQNLRFW